MPIYEYSCCHCQHHFETLVLRASDCASACPRCGHTKVERLISAGSCRPHGIAKGSGGFKAPKCAPAGGG